MCCLHETLLKSFNSLVIIIILLLLWCITGWKSYRISIPTVQMDVLFGFRHIQGPLIRRKTIIKDMICVIYMYMQHMSKSSQPSCAAANTHMTGARNLTHCFLGMPTEQWVRFWVPATVLRGSWSPRRSGWRAVTVESIILIQPLWTVIRAMTCWTTTPGTEAEWDRKGEGYGGTNSGMSFSRLCRLDDKCALMLRLALAPPVQLAHLHGQQKTNGQCQSRSNELQRHVYVQAVFFPWYRHGQDLMKQHET